ncbi:hypothetical protein [Streptomyces sp.]|uniref:hypothetical protein n=1 Tax=Streptomyces sp. TaxID=1931 RepID=UPI002F929389
MSIYATLFSIDDDGHELTCAHYAKTSREEAEDSGRMVVSGDAYYRWDATADCTCGNRPPIIYQGSHINPALQNARGGWLLVCGIPDHCHPDARGSGDVGQPVGFLRLTAGEDETTYHGMQPGQATLILEVGQVRALQATLAEWLATRGSEGEEPHV